MGEYIPWFTPRVDHVYMVTYIIISTPECVHDRLDHFSFIMSQYYHGIFDLIIINECIPRCTGHWRVYRGKLRLARGGYAVSLPKSVLFVDYLYGIISCVLIGHVR